jgi:hypothetical protein
VATFGWILATKWCRLLAPAASMSAFHHSSPIVRLGLSAAADAVVSSTWTAGAAALWNASVDDTTSTYFLATHNLTCLCKFNTNVEDLLIFMKF